VKKKAGLHECEDGNALGLPQQFAGQGVCSLQLVFGREVQQRVACLLDLVREGEAEGRVEVPAQGGPVQGGGLRPLRLRDRALKLGLQRQ